MKYRSILSLLMTMWLYSPLAGQSGIDYVDLFIGTAGDHGQNHPAACVPYGMVKVGPDTDPASHVGYNYQRDTLMGVSINRISGVGCSGAGGNLRVLPVINGDRNIRMDKVHEVAEPGYYETRLSNKVLMKLTATHNMAIERFQVPRGDSLTLQMDTRSSFARFLGGDYQVNSDGLITGTYRARNVCNKGRYIQHYAISVDQPYRFEQDDPLQLHLIQARGKWVEVRIALSAISQDKAVEELHAQSNLTFHKVKSQAYRCWKQKLDKVEVKGGTNHQMKMFYTSLYRWFMNPSQVTSHDGYYRDSQGKIQKAEGFNYYSGWSIWGTYRTRLPLQSLIDRDRYSEFCRSLVALYQSGKKPWSTDHEPTPTVRTEHAMIVLLDAVRKGINGVDLKDIYDQMKRVADSLPMDSPDNHLESAYDYWALSHIARRLWHDHQARYYLDRSRQVWRSIWKEKFRDIDPATFDIMHGDGLYEGTLWQYRWAVPYDIQYMAKLAAGDSLLVRQLSQFFNNDLYNHGNEPDIHAAFIFNRLGRPDLTQKWVNRILTRPMKHRYGTHSQFDEPYVGKAYRPVPEAFIPEMDDDAATMSAWYVWAAMGLYPLVVGEPYYEITEPLFDQVILHLDKGNTFSIKNRVDGEINYLKINEENRSDFRIRHQQIMEGGRLILK